MELEYMPSFLGKNIKYLRVQKKLSQTELADGLGISRNKIASYENKGIEPRLSLLFTIADFFDVTVDQLITQDISSLKESGLSLHRTGQSSLNDSTGSTTLVLSSRTTLTEFIQKNTSVQKMLEGFYVFYKMKLETYNDQDTMGFSDIKTDIENILFLVEYLLKENKILIRELSSQ